MSEYPTPLQFLQLIQTDWPEDTLIDGGILSRGDSLLIGAESKAGKSTMMSLLIRELITGGNFLGFKITRPLKVFYMQAELKEARLKGRLLPTYKDLSEEALSNSYVWNTRGVILLGRDDKLIYEHLARFQPDVLFIDPLINFHTYDENSATDMSKLTRIFDGIKDEFNLSLILSHHFRKSLGQNASESLLERLRGSSALRGWMDTTIAIEGRTKSEYRRLEFDTRNSDEPIRRLIHYNSKTKDFDWHDPINEIYDMLCKEMEATPHMPTTQVMQLILKKCGHLVSRNRTKAFEIKDVLLSTKQLVTKEGEGRTVLLALPD